jgi:hypothetical protein
MFVGHSVSLLSSHQDEYCKIIKNRLKLELPDTLHNFIEFIWGRMGQRMNPPSVGHSALLRSRNSRVHTGRDASLCTGGDIDRKLKANSTYSHLAEHDSLHSNEESICKHRANSKFKESCFSDDSSREVWTGCQKKKKGSWKQKVGLRRMSLRLQ